MVKKKVLGFEESAKDMDEFGEIIIYQTDNGLSKIEVNLKMKQYGFQSIRWRSCFKETEVL